MGERTWAVPSPHSFFKTAQATHSANASKDQLSVLKRGFLCLLVEPYTFLLQIRSPKAKGIVLGSTDQGVNLWNSRVSKAARQDFWVAMEPSDDARMWSQVFVQEPSDWMELEVTALPPCVKRPSEPEPMLGDCVGIYLVAKHGAEPTPLLRAAATRAFHRLNVELLRALAASIADFEWPTPRPRSEFDICNVIMKHVLSAATYEQLGAAILELRGPKTPKPKWTSVFTNMTTAAIGDLLDRDEASDLLKSVARLGEAMKLREQARHKLHPGTRAKARPRKKLAGVAGGVALSRDEAKAYLPIGWA